jgi:RNase H-fold protein (predicted Holliday junction resolvase)
LLCAHDALEHSIDGFEVARVCGEIHGNRLSAGRGKCAFSAEVVLDVARALNGLGVLRALKLAEDLAVGLPGDVRQHVEPASVGHSDRYLFEVRFGRLLEDRVKEWDERLATFEAESLLASFAGTSRTLPLR